MLGCPGGSPGRALTIMAVRIAANRVRSCLWSFAAGPPLYLPYLPVYLTIKINLKKISKSLLLYYTVAIH